MSRAIVVAALVVGCSANHTRPDDGALEERMLDHFFVVTAIERAVVRGDVEEARLQARKLAAPRTGDPASWAPHVARLQQAARSVSDSSELSGAAHGVGAILEACYRCHRDLGADVEPVSIPEPPAGDSVAARMRRHQWGVDLLRVGLVFGDDAVWQRGAEVLTEAPLHPAELAESGRINPETIARTRALRELAAAAKGRKMEERFETYDGLLSTCVGCHSEPGTSGPR